jgi:hypothetical protein
LSDVFTRFSAFVAAIPFFFSDIVLRIFHFLAYIFHSLFSQKKRDRTSVFVTAVRADFSGLEKYTQTNGTAFFLSFKIEAGSRVWTTSGNHLLKLIHSITWIALSSGNSVHIGSISHNVQLREDPRITSVTWIAPNWTRREKWCPDHDGWMDPGPSKPAENDTASL